VEYWLSRQICDKLQRAARPHLARPPTDSRLVVPVVLPRRISAGLCLCSVRESALQISLKSRCICGVSCISGDSYRRLPYRYFRKPNVECGRYNVAATAVVTRNLGFALKQQRVPTVPALPAASKHRAAYTASWCRSSPNTMPTAFRNNHSVTPHRHRDSRENVLCVFRCKCW
jgi:hypothetical protein